MIDYLHMNMISCSFPQKSKTRPKNNFHKRSDLHLHRNESKDKTVCTWKTSVGCNETSTNITLKNLNPSKMSINAATVRMVEYKTFKPNAVMDLSEFRWNKLNKSKFFYDKNLNDIIKDLLRHHKHPLKILLKLEWSLYYNLT